MQPSPNKLLERVDIETPLIGFYDAPSPIPFRPLVKPRLGNSICIFTFYKKWLEGKTLYLTKDNDGCNGCGHWVFGYETRSRDEYLKFLVDEEGLKESYNLMNQWLDHVKPYKPEYEHILISPLRQDQYKYLKTVTFLVNPDQFSVLMLGAQYNNSPKDAPAVIAPFGSGCMELVSLFEDLNIPQAMIGITDVSVRRYLPSNILAFTVTKPLFEQLCKLDERSFLHKPFLKQLKVARGRSIG